MSVSIRSVDAPTISEFAKVGLGWEERQIPSDFETLRSAVVAESIRMSLYLLYARNHPAIPIHNLEVRNWIRHKILPIIPDLFDSEESSYRQVLTEGRGVNLEFLGDAIILSDGYVSPGPTRLVDIGGDSHLLISGLPTANFLHIGRKIVHTQMGRRLDNISISELEEKGFRTQSLENYIGKPEGIQPPPELIRTILSSVSEPWISDPSWQAYLGNLEPGGRVPNSRYGFCWALLDASDANHAFTCEFENSLLSIWKRLLPGSYRYYSYWLKEQSGSTVRFYSLARFNWKQTCIALDAIAGRSRQSFFSRSQSNSITAISLGFPPFESLAKVLFAFGAILRGRSRGLDTWEIPTGNTSKLRNVLERAGVNVRIL